jgi:peptide/nickel transport system ATP-binding protein
MSAAPVLDIRGLCITAGGRRVVDGASLQVHDGETLCLVGESGSGKSVTALSVMGLLPRPALRPAAGSILLEDEDVLQAAPARLRALRTTRMAMIFQEPMTALNPVMTAGAQIAEVLRAHTGLGASERKRRVLDMLEKVHLPEPERILRSYPHRLSGGQRQRIMIAMALILRPKLLIADEPTTALDVTTQKQILALIRELRESEGTAVLFITHDMGVVAEIADRVAVMRQGRLVEAGPLHQILRKPQEDYTRELLSAVPSLVPRAARIGAAKAPAILEVSNLSKTYREQSLTGRRRTVRAVTDVSFTLSKGQTIGIVGESGSGKTTVARCVMRLIEPAGGSIRVAGREISHLSRRALRPHRKAIQMVFQDPFRSLNPRVPVGETIAEGPVNFGMPRSEGRAKAIELLEMVGLPSDAAGRFPHEFSGGQRQRIAIARALAMNPDVLVADEAVSALDVSVQAQVLTLLASVQRRTGAGLLFITHDLRVAAQICDEVIVMQNGRIVERGAASAILTAPKEAYTQELIEAAPGRHWDFKAFAPTGSTPHPAASRPPSPARGEGYPLLCAPRSDFEVVPCNAVASPLAGEGQGEG